MKKFFLIIFCIVFLFCGCSVPPSTQPDNTALPLQEMLPPQQVRGVWLAYYELQEWTKEKDEKTFTAIADEAFSSLAATGFNRIAVQVRPCADAFYISSYFPSSRYCVGQQGAPLAYDPLAILCSLAKQHGLALEAWINPYRVSQDNQIEALCETHPARVWLADKKTASRVYIMPDTIYFNPASKAVKELIVNGVKEIIEQYDVCGVQFDDYFYPTKKKNIDAKEYKKYCKKGGTLSLAAWRRKNVSSLIQAVYQTVKETNPVLTFGISPASDIQKNYASFYADVETWAREDGYCDYICPQVYFGFKNEHQPFMFTVKKWMYVTNRDLYIGLPLYKAGLADEYAGEPKSAAVAEFQKNNNILARQITYLSKLPSIKGFYLFSYGSLQEARCQEEVNHLLQAMQDSSPPPAAPP